ncbi:hypothetical protein Plhal304r1_c059g0147771 [Plasmopara halstedii]
MPSNDKPFHFLEFSGLYVGNLLESRQALDTIASSFFWWLLVLCSTEFQQQRSRDSYHLYQSLSWKNV